MIKHLSKVLLAALVVTGSAKALVYNDTKGNSIELNGQADTYFVNNGYLSNPNRDKACDPLVYDRLGSMEMTGKVRLDGRIMHQVNPDLTFGAVIRADFIGIASDSKTATHVDVQRAYGLIEHKRLGTVMFGRYEGFAGRINDFSDIDVLIGSLAHNPEVSTDGVNVLGGGTETGVEFDKVVANGKLLLVGSLSAGGWAAAPAVPVFCNGSQDKIYNNLRVGIGAQYKVNEQLTLAVSYSVADYNSSNRDYVNNEQFKNGDKDKYVKTAPHHMTLAQYAIFGGQVDTHGFHVGITGSIQNYNTWGVKRDKVVEFKPGIHDIDENAVLTRHKGYGFEVGMKYDLSQGKNVGFRPGIQYDYRTEHQNSLTRADTAKDGTVGDKESYSRQLVTASMLELSLAYYVTPSFHYVASVGLDLRNKDQIYTVDNAYAFDKAYDKSDVVAHNVFGLGVVYSF